jgi:hypothetical protein
LWPREAREIIRTLTTPALPSRRRAAVVRVVAFMGDLSERLRWLFLPLALFSLLCVGIHAAADAMEDRLLWAVDATDALVDGWLSAWAFSSPAVEWVGTAQRTAIARAIALVWELGTDIVIALPVLWYREPPGGADAVTDPNLALHKLRALVETARSRLKRPGAPANVVIPACAVMMVLAGSCAVGRMLQGALYLSLEPVNATVASAISRTLAILVLVGTLLVFGTRAVQQLSIHVELRVSSGRPAVALSRSALAMALSVPLAILALIEASPVLSFFR